MAVVYYIVLNNYIFGRLAPVATVLVFARLKANGIVTDIKYIVVYYRIFAGFQIQAVAVLRKLGVTHIQVPEGYVFAHERVQVPGRRILKGGAIEQHFFAAD